MKNAIILSALLVGSFAMAQGESTSATSAAAPTEAKVMSHSDATKACKKEGKKKNPELAQCVKEKMGK